MLIIDENGNYVYQSGTKTLKSSDHPVYQARIELALGQNKWLCAPSDGHDLAKYGQEKQTNYNVEEFQKDLAFYLTKYGPVVSDLLVTRQAVSLDLSIDAKALNV